MPEPLSHPHEVHDLVGGMPAFERLVDAFYGRVQADEVLRPMYPDDLEPGKRHLALFLAQYFGGGPVYGRERGHPRLRRRHVGFPITPDAAQRWAVHMRAAVREQGWPAAAEQQVLGYVDRATPTLINRLPADVEPRPDQGLPLGP